MMPFPVRILLMLFSLMLGGCGDLVAAVVPVPARPSGPGRATQADLGNPAADEQFCHGARRCAGSRVRDYIARFEKDVRPVEQR